MHYVIQFLLCSSKCSHLTIENLIYKCLIGLLSVSGHWESLVFVCRVCDVFSKNSNKIEMKMCGIIKFGGSVSDNLSLVFELHE